ncbi:MAG: hypothetical protein R3C71_11315 [Candidatus Krumholzibacteriia bacterium]
MGYIGSLVSLDHLGFDCAAHPSWGQLAQQGMDDVTTAWWLVLHAPGRALLHPAHGDLHRRAVREAFDPKVFEVALAWPSEQLFEVRGLTTRFHTEAAPPRR